MVGCDYSLGLWDCTIALWWIPWRYVKLNYVKFNGAPNMLTAGISLLLVGMYSCRINSMEVIINAYE